tara:strand:- start:439 stop:573 length:135 start_codon:yes stop_codon:yes gene_type:complete
MVVVEEEPIIHKMLVSLVVQVVEVQIVGVVAQVLVLILILVQQM